jgi:hypothetical protein
MASVKSHPFTIALVCPADATGLAGVVGERGCYLRVGK